jgi:Leucine-rich repeat (LRR) protein
MYASNKLPKVTAGSSITKFEISPTTNVSNYSFSKEEISNFFENLGKCSIGTLNLNSFGTLDTLTYLSSLNSCGITTLYLPDYTKNPSQTYSKIKSLSGIENLITLQYLYCQNNSITSLKELSNLTSLKYLDLSNNLIYDTSSYVDEKGETVTYNNLEILAKLNKYNKGKLEQLYLEGNSSIISFSPIQSLTWVAKSGF